MEAVRAALEECARTSPEILDGLVTEDWALRYGRHVRLVSQPSHQAARFKQGSDAADLLDRIHTVPGRIGTDEIRAVDRAVTTIYAHAHAHDHDHDSAALRRDVSRALHTAYQWLQEGTCTDRNGKWLRSATGHLSIEAGWLSYDSGRAADARSLYGEALAAARIAEDPGLEGHGFGCLSLPAKASGRPCEAISAAQGAQAVVRTYGSPRMLALFAMREAGGWALLGRVSLMGWSVDRMRLSVADH